MRNLRALSIFKAAALVGVISIAFETLADETGILKEFFSSRLGITVRQFRNFHRELNLYEIVGDNLIYYTDSNTRYIIKGDVYTTGNDVNLTRNGRSKLPIAFEKLPLHLSVKKVTGNGKYKIAIFIDPDCPWCKKVARLLPLIYNATIYIFLYPPEHLFSQSPIARRIWCSQNRENAWDDFMLRDVTPTATATCDNPIDEIRNFARSMDIETDVMIPILVYEDGERDIAFGPFFVDANRKLSHG